MITEAEIQSSLGDWSDPEFRIGDTKFRVTKLSPMEAFVVLEKVRVAAAPVFSGFDENQTESGFAAIVSEFLKIDSAQLMVIMDDLFGNIRFTNSIAKTEVILRGNMDMAFKDLLPTHIYEVLARSLVVNFLESFYDILRRGAGGA